MQPELSLLVIVAHPDDAESYCGGTIARLTRAGHCVRLVVCTSGDRGSHHCEVSPSRLVKLRREEQQQAQEILGIREVLWLDYADGELSQKTDLRDKLIRLYRQYRPDVIITFDPWKHYEFHPDHRAVGYMATESRMLADLPWICPELTLEGISAWHPQEMYLFAPEEANYWVDISEEIDRKVEARLAHHSQNDFIHSEADRAKFIDEIKNNAITSGKSCRYPYAEAFHKVDGTNINL